MADQHVQRTDRQQGARKRAIALAVYGVAFVLWWRILGLPSDIIAALMWGWLAVICWRIDRPFRSQLVFLRDWLPLVVLLSAYDVSRGLAGQGAQPHVTEMIRFDRWLFGGHIPTVWLQEHFYDPNGVHWWDVVASWTYYSHFVSTPIVAVVLWLRAREIWGAFIRRWISLSAVGLFTYFTWPAAPPWWAGEAHLIPPTQRISGRGWDILGLRTGGHLMSLARDLSNPIAAMPSLHAAFSLLVVAFFIRRVRRRWVPLLLAYPVMMGATLVYSGEHWVTDVIVGWLYVGGVFLVVGLGERAWARWHAPPPQPPAAEPAEPRPEKVEEPVGALH